MRLHKAFPVLLVVSLLVGSAHADEPPVDATAAARAAFDEGVAFVRDARWGEALASFERAHATRPHALTAYNMGVSERALGRLTRARGRLREALNRNETAAGRELAQSLADEARALLAEIEARLIRLEVTIEPADAGFAIDGRPVAPEEGGEAAVMVAGLLPPATDRSAGPAKFTVVADPGKHVLSASKKGFVTATVDEAYKPGDRASVSLSLLQQDGEVAVASDSPGAAVRVDGVDVGIAPVTLRRPAGRHSVEVRKVGHHMYTTSVDLRPGERSSLLATLRVETIPITSRWYFWGALGATTVAVASTVIYFLLPSRPYDGGNTGWVAEPR